MVGLAREIFGGDLRDVSSNSLLLLAHAEAVSGWIRVEPRGAVGLVGGRVVDARSGPRSGVPARREPLFHDAGRFTVVRGEPSGTCIVEDTTAVVMDAYRLRDEWARISSAVLRRAMTACASAAAAPRCARPTTTPPSARCGGPSSCGRAIARPCKTYVPSPSAAAIPCRPRNSDEWPRTRASAREGTRAQIRH